MTLALPNEIGRTVGADDRPFFEATWTDPVTGAPGYLVLDRLVRGISSGGLRMRHGCTLDEVRGLARGMTFKEAVHYEEDARYVPLGGAKGGIDFDPDHPDAEGVLFRYLAAMKPLIEQRWTMGEDFGVRQDAVDRGIAAIGLTSSVQAAYAVLDDRAAAEARMATAFDTDVDGVALDELVGGYGVAVAALTALERAGRSPDGARAVVQGFGSMGGATARYLARAGMRVVGIADVDGVVADPDGLDVERLLRSRDATGRVDRTQLTGGAHELPSSAWLDLDCDVLVPAATSYCIDADNHERVRARFVVEAANMPVTPEAERALTERGTTIVPDFIANSGTNAWWWWVLFGDIDGSAEQSFAKLDARMRSLTTEMFDVAQRDGVSPRAAAFALATERMARITDAYPAL